MFGVVRGASAGIGALRGAAFVVFAGCVAVDTGAVEGPEADPDCVGDACVGAPVEPDAPVDAASGVVVDELSAAACCSPPYCSSTGHQDRSTEFLSCTNCL